MLQTKPEIHQKTKKTITYLITANLSGNVVQSLNDTQTELLALLTLLNGNVLDVADQTKRVNELALDNQTTSSDNTVLSIADHEHVVLIIARLDPLVALVPLFLSDLTDSSQHTQDIEVTTAVVRSAQRADCVVCWEDGDDFWGDKRGREERAVVLDVNSSHGGVDGWLGRVLDGGR